jgi:hypothetical protein
VKGTWWLRSFFEVGAESKLFFLPTTFIAHIPAIGRIFVQHTAFCDFTWTIISAATPQIFEYYANGEEEDAVDTKGVQA